MSETVQASRGSNFQALRIVAILIIAAIAFLNYVNVSRPLLSNEGPFTRSFSDTVTDPIFIVSILPSVIVTGFVLTVAGMTETVWKAVSWFVLGLFGLFYFFEFISRMTSEWDYTQAALLSSLLHVALAATLGFALLASRGTAALPARAEPGTKECSACAETIKKNAKKCRYCGEILAEN